MRSEGKINEQFEVMLNNLTLEEIIAIKLELSSKTLGTPLYGALLWKHLDMVVRESVLLCAISITQTISECARYIGVDVDTARKLINKHQLTEYYKPNYIKARMINNEKARQAALAQSTSTDEQKNV